jgi:hypothetical protein
MPEDKVLATETIKHSDLISLGAALTKMIQHARFAADGPFAGGSSVLVEESSGWKVSRLVLVEETLSDKSKALKVRLLF